MILPPHITYLAFSDGGDAVSREVGLSALSLLCLASRAVQIRVLSDSPQILQNISQCVGTQERMQFCRGSANTSLELSVQLVSLDRIRYAFHLHGIRHVVHHSQWGGYAKLLLEELLPPGIVATLFVDSDTVFALDVTQTVWPLLNSFAPRQLLAARKLNGWECISRRLNSGVMLMHLQRMRQRRWGHALLALARSIAFNEQLPHKIGMCQFNQTRQKLARPINNATGIELVVGDQEFISLGCMTVGDACGPLPLKVHYDYCDRPHSGWLPGGVVYHFNCHGIPSACPDAKCRLFAERFRTPNATLWKSRELEQQ